MRPAAGFHPQQTGSQLRKERQQLPASKLTPEHRAPAKFGHQVKLMSPRFVGQYVKSNKNDARDAEAESH